jgi:hypothetical protein
VVVSSLFRSKPFSFLPGRLALIQGGDKLIYNEPFLEGTTGYFTQDPPPVPRFEWYDIRRDPGERINLFEAGGEILPRIRRMHRSLLELAGRMEENRFGEAEGEGVSMPRELIDQLKALGYIR